MLGCGMACVGCALMGAMIASSSYERKMAVMTEESVNIHHEWLVEYNKRVECEVSLEKSIRETVACNDNFTKASKDYGNKVQELNACVDKFNKMFRSFMHAK